MIIGPDTSKKVADQIASLVNQNNKLGRQYEGSEILSSDSHYYPLVIEGIVVASVAVKKLNYLLSEIRHLVVRPEARRQGLGVQMVKMAIRGVKTPLMCATIREDNKGSMKVFAAHKFRRLSKITYNDHSIFYYFRET